jgi:hypothetical protein
MGLYTGVEAYTLGGGLTVFTGGLYMDNIGNQVFVNYKHEKKQKLYYYIQHLGGGIIFGGELIFGMV